ncbi:hypothetical protein D6851_05070 [Altericroceibacterium spongiae]|uniref:Uncharacterized protein n=1 Tax=Altericroceibacterium spongiae TaxID=2320269 RepID=A0A420EPI8_9SPHN|nr:hypothetical protein [Altericroceibacterium spongiae]RKF22592.1 hypothetical protein D6851_05070 [Altericroceibacterium spongiae]
MEEPIKEDTPDSKSNAKWLWLALIVLLGILVIVWLANPTSQVEEVTPDNAAVATDETPMQESVAPTTENSAAPAEETQAQ